MKNKLIPYLLVLALTIGFFSVTAFANSEEQDTTIYISSADDLKELSENCALDAWSREKNIVLTQNISLEGTDFEPIPSFSGYFDGGGYTISGLEIDGAYSPSALFAVTEAGSVIKNLTVTAKITPAGDKSYVGGIVGDNSGAVENCRFIGTIIGKSYVGGIAGINRINGIIKGSYAQGEIIGENSSGGIAGANYGMISLSENEAKVNTISLDSSITLDELNTALTLDITRLPSLDNIGISDTGGIVGYNVGMILDSVNSAVIGYKHIGYNVGGIAGRSCGHIANCTNKGEILGRKDVGGIVGQMEPSVSYNLSEDLLLRLKTEIHELSSAVDEAVISAESSGGAISARLDRIIDLLGEIRASSGELIDESTSYGSDVINEVNRASEILDVVIGHLAEATEKLPKISEKLSLGLGELGNATGEAYEAVAHITDGLEKIRGGFNALKSAIGTQDQEAADSALSDLSDGISEISTAMSTLSDIASKLGSSDEGGVSLENVGALSGALSDFSEALVKIGNGINGIRENFSIDTTELWGGLNLILEGLGELISASENIESALNYTSLAMGYFSDAASLMTSVLEEADEIMKYLDSTEPTIIPTPSDSIRIAANEVNLLFMLFELELKYLNFDINDMGTELSERVVKINEKASAVSDTLIDIASGISNSNNTVEDLSEEDVFAVTDGKVFAAENYGDIYADINVGGIAGIIGFEYELDPEDDLSSELSLSQIKKYELRAVIQSSKNFGKICAKRDCVGGISGKIEMGFVYSCEAYGEICSELGNYVGGIAGICSSSIADSFSKCSLSGSKYVGGIVGSGVAEDYSGDTSTVINCYALPDITKYTQYAGAIAGIGGGKYENNYFVSDTLRGIDRTSFVGCAEPIGYEELIKRKFLPDEFYKFTLSFVADEEIIKTVEFNYGDSFDSSSFPDIPKKDGHYGKFDKTDLTNLTFDTKVSVIYQPYITSLEGGVLREDGREVFFARGNFDDNDKLTVSKSQTSDLPILAKNLFFIEQPCEAWNVIIPVDDAEIHTLHLLTDGIDTEDAAIYVKENGVWRRADTMDFGSYLIFEVSGGVVDVAVAKISVRILPIVLFSALFVVLVLTVVLTIIKIKKRKCLTSCIKKK